MSQQIITPPRRTDAQIEERLRQAIEVLRGNITDAQTIAGATFANNTQRDNAIKALARHSEAASRVLIGLCRMVGRDLSGTD
jgi:hypothetical protein